MVSMEIDWGVPQRYKGWTVSHTGAWMEAEDVGKTKPPK